MPWTKFNDVNNQDAITFSFINPFLNQPYMFQATNSPILRSTFWLYIQHLLQCPDNTANRCHGWDGTQEFHLNRGTGRQYCQCIVPKAVYTVKKCSWGWANLSPETCRADLKRINKQKGCCCILLVVYIVVLLMHGHTNIKNRV